MSQGPLQSALVTAAHRILRSLVRQLIRHGITFPVASKLLKRVYVEVAAEEGKLPGRKLSDSRIALLTGIPRKEVARLRHLAEPESELPLDAHFATRLISRWTSDPRFQTPDGEPQILPFDEEGGTPNFSELVRLVGQDIPPRAVLDELVRVGAVEVSRARDVRLLARRYIPVTGTAEKVDMLGTDASEFIETVGHNITAPPDEAYLQQKIEFDNVGSRGAPILRRRLRELAEPFLRQVEDLMARYDRDRNPTAPGGERIRVVLGAYYFEEKAGAAPEAREAEKGPHKETGSQR